MTTARIRYINAAAQEFGLTGEFAIPPRATERAEIKWAVAARWQTCSFRNFATTAPIEIRGSNGI